MQSYFSSFVVYIEQEMPVHLLNSGENELMTAKDNTTLVQGIYEAINSHQSDPAWFDKASASIAEDFEGINPRGLVRHGVEGFDNHIGNWVRAFPGLQIQVTDIFSTRDHTCAEFIGRGVHTGTLQGPLGEIQPTGKQVEVRFCEVYRFKRGQVASIHTYYDMQDLMRQLGASK